MAKRTLAPLVVALLVFALLAPLPLASQILPTLTCTGERFTVYLADGSCFDCKINVCCWLLPDGEIECTSWSQCKPCGGIVK